jgi:Rad3-related DNA helicase
MIAHTMLKREEGWRNTDRTSWGAVLSDHRRCGSSPHTLAGTDRSSRAFGCHRNYDSIRRPRKQYADFVIVTIHQLMDSASKSPLRMNRLCYDEAHVLAAKITKLQSQYHIPSNADHLWAVTATPSHAKYLSENFGNITKVLVFRRQPVCCTTPTRSTPFGR